MLPIHKDTPTTCSQVVALEGRHRKEWGSPVCIFFFKSMNRCLPPVLIESPKVLPFYWSTPKAHPGLHDTSALALGTMYFHRHWHRGLVSKYLQVPHSNFRKVKFAKVPWQAGLPLVFINLGKHTIIKHSIWRVSLKSLESTLALDFQKLTYSPCPPFLDTHQVPL